MVGIVDEALERGNDDELQIDQYTQALVEFIKLTDTPMTIGIQGEWGSGKTSLLNQIWHQLDALNREDSTIGDFKQIWINSWENALLSKPEEALIKIINEIINELLKSDTDKHRVESIKNGVKNVLNGALRIGSTVAMGSAGKDIADDVIGSDSNSIKLLRTQLASLTEEIKNRPTNSYEKIVIYVDDLDRIEPAEAVKILELLKNIFNVKHCIFLLAIDYQVVVKGLQSKFGQQTPENEWEFRAFFDKIIQLPFKMPMSSYNIGNYVLELLNKVNFYSGKDELDEGTISEIVTFSIGGNPRSIKRLINSLSLIKIFLRVNEDVNVGEKLDDKDLATTIFAMVCCQIAFPDIYELLRSEPEFTKWNEDLAYKFTQRREELDNNFLENFEKAKTLEDFDEPWEQALFRICYEKPRLRAKAAEVSQLLSLLKEELPEDKLSNLISTSLASTAVTSVVSDDKPNLRPPKGSYKRFFVEGKESWLNKWLEDHQQFETLPPYITNIVEVFINTAINKFDAVDHVQDPEAEVTIKYSGPITIYFKKRKIAGLYISANKRGISAGCTFLKSPKYDNKPIILNSRTFHHPRKFVILNEETKECKGAVGFYDFQDVGFKDPEFFNEAELEFLLNMSKEVIEKYSDDKLNEKFVKEHRDNFINKRRDSKAFEEAVKFFNEHNDETTWHKITI
jgi:hypothetical protein